MPRTANTYGLLAGLLLTSLVAGCAPWKVPTMLKMPGKTEKLETPQRFTALWTDTVLVEAGVVGFGGRVMFYGRDQDDPIMVEGELTVYAYDDTEEKPANSVPARKYVFRAEDLSKHYSKSSLGHSYSFWFPWAAVGGPQRQVSLVARFKSTAGGVIMSEMSKHFLPGSVEAKADTRELPDTTIIRSSAVERVQQVAHQAPVDPPAETKAGMTTTTIALPPRLGRTASDAMSMAETKSVAQAANEGSTAGTGPPKAPAPSAQAAAGQAEAVDAQALLREVRALREMMESGQDGPGDRFGFRRPRARIAPKLT